MTLNRARLVHVQAWKNQSIIKWMRNAIICVCVIVSYILIGAGGQLAGGAAQNVGISSSPPNIPRPLPFSPGEILTYDIAFSKFFLSGTVGQLKLSVGTVPSGAGKSVDVHPGNQASPAGSGESKSPGAPTVLDASQSMTDRATTSSSQGASQDNPIKFEAETVSKGFVTWLFDLKVDDKYQSIVNWEDLGLIKSTKFVEEGNKHRQQETVVDRLTGSVTYSDKDLNSETATANVKKASSPPWVQDLLSAIYFLRTQDLKPGGTLTVPVTDKGELHNIDVVVGKREQVDVEAGKFNALAVEIMVFDGKYVKRSGQLLIWFTDDSRRLPVRARIKSSGATATIKLTHIEAGTAAARP
jgi:hypothetical protein